MCSPLVSVIIPAYNSGKFIACAIQSVLEQTFKDLELIVIDDGSSTFKCQEITENFKKISSLPIHYFYQEHRGPAASRNYGIQQARGKFISFLDSDDFYEPYKITLQLSLLNQLPPDYAGVFGASAVFLNADPSRITIVSPPVLDGLVYRTMLEEHHGLPLSCGSLLRKSSLQAVGGFDESLQYGEDFHLLLRIAHRFKIKTHPEIVYWERKRKDSLSHANPQRNVEHSLQFLDKLQAIDPTVPKKIFDFKKKKAFFQAASQYLFIHKSYNKFRFFMEEGVKNYGLPDTYREWVGFLFSKVLSFNNPLK